MNSALIDSLNLSKACNSFVPIPKNLLFLLLIKSILSCISSSSDLPALSFLISCCKVSLKALGKLSLLCIKACIFDSIVCNFLLISFCSSGISSLLNPSLLNVICPDSKAFCNSIFNSSISPSLNLSIALS